MRCLPTLPVGMQMSNRISSYIFGKDSLLPIYQQYGPKLVRVLIVPTLACDL